MDSARNVERRRLDGSATRSCCTVVEGTFERSGPRDENFREASQGPEIGSPEGWRHRTILGAPARAFKERAWLAEPGRFGGYFLLRPWGDVHWVRRHALPGTAGYAFRPWAPRRYRRRRFRHGEGRQRRRRSQCQRGRNKRGHAGDAARDHQRSGVYAFPELPIGRYNVSIEKEGFKPYRRVGSSGKE